MKKHSLRKSMSFNRHHTINNKGGIKTQVFQPKATLFPLPRDLPYAPIGRVTEVPDRQQCSGHGFALTALQRRSGPYTKTSKAMKGDKDRHDALRDTRGSSEEHGLWLGSHTGKARGRVDFLEGQQAKAFQAEGIVTGPVLENTGHRPKTQS